MRLSSGRSLVVLLALLGAGACSSSNSVSPGGNGGGGGGNGPHIKATINGAAWASNAGNESTGTPTTLPGVFAITGTQLSGSNNYSMTINLYNIGGPGTYPLGVGPSVPGGSVLLSKISGGWGTAQSGSDGTITITTLTSTHIAATFSFTAVPTFGGAAGTLTVTNGDLDLVLKPTGAIGPLPANAGSSLSATIGGAAWNAANVSNSLHLGNGGQLVIAAQSSTHGLGISLTGVSGPGTYQLGANGAVTTSTISPNYNWSSAGAGGSGSVTITSVTTTRAKGTFTATLGPAPGFPTPTPSTFTVTNGTFDIGLIAPP